MSDRQRYVEKLKARLDEWNAEIDKLEAKARRSKADAGIQYDKLVGDLRSMKDDTSARLAEIQRAGEDSWEHLKEGAEKAWASFKNAVEKAMAEFN